jgi:hypothetical protein
MGSEYRLIMVVPFKNNRRPVKAMLARDHR